MGKSHSCLEMAQRYNDFGWSVIPVVSGQKKAGVAWKQFQSKRADCSQLDDWFVNDRHSPAVVFGKVSGGLASRDFDTLESYEVWASAHPGLARTLPTVATARGRHVYFRLNDQSRELVRERLGGRNGAVALGDGELRFDSGCYSVLPPAIHPSGKRYEWVIDPEREVPELDAFASGLASQVTPVERQWNTENAGRTQSNTERSDNTEVTENKVDSRELNLMSEGTEPPVFSVYHAEIAKRIKRNLPSIPGQRHRKLFNLLRDLQSLPELKGRKWNDIRSTIIPIVRHWFRMVENVVTSSIEETLIDAAEGWNKVRTPKGEDIVAHCLEQARQNPTPDCAKELSTPEFRLLVGLCHELQRKSGEQSFYLSSRTVEEHLGIPHATAYRYLQFLEGMGILKLTKRGTQGAGGLANEFRYLGA